MSDLLKYGVLKMFTIKDISIWRLMTYDWNQFITADRYCFNLTRQKITFRWWWRCWNEIWVSVVDGRKGCLAMSLSPMVCNTVIYPPLKRNMCCPCHVWLRWGWLTDGGICITIDQLSRYGSIFVILT